MLKYNNVKIENSLGEKSELKLISISFKFLGIIYQDLTREDEKGLETGQKVSVIQYQSDQNMIFKPQILKIHNSFEPKTETQN